MTHEAEPEHLALEAALKGLIWEPEVLGFTGGQFPSGKSTVLVSCNERLLHRSVPVRHGWRIRIHGKVYVIRGLHTDHKQSYITRGEAVTLTVTRE